MEKISDNHEGWEIPQRQSGAAIIMMLLKTAIEMLKLLWPAILIFFLRDNKGGDRDNKVLLLVAGFFILTCIVSFIKYWFYRFHINQNNLIIQSGWLKKKTLTIPLQHIQEVHYEQNLWQRALKVVTITIDSAGSENAEAKIDALSHKKAEGLKALLLSHASAQSLPEDTPVRKKSKLSTGDLFKFSLSANHLEAFVIIVSLSLNVLEDIKDAFKIDSWNWMKGQATQLAGQTTVIITVLVTAVAIISVIVSIIRTLIKFYDFTIEDIQNGWKISFGLFNKEQKVIPSNKIQILSWKANWLRRKLDFWIVNAMSIGQKKTKRKEQVQIPVTSLQKVVALTPVYQRSPVFVPSTGSGIQSAYWKRKFLFRGLPGTLIIMLIFYLWIGNAGLLMSLLVFYFLWYYNKWYKVFRWQINEEGIQLYTGAWGRKYRLMTWKKVQQVQVHQTIFQRSHGLATIVFFTAGGKISVPYIQLIKANDLANLTLFYVESRNEHWM